ncbi:MAG: hypothetical protein HYR72_23335 [Deltaproteobacteria bacterium]|nr:hypothetical protein [Deltaproteobacteria bacterium]MBI3389033.1 hypothetical protein [Deltaproteobacteria bacterium]
MKKTVSLHVAALVAGALSTVPLAGCKASKPSAPPPVSAAADDSHVAGTTQTIGAVPDLRGTWLLISHLEIDGTPSSRINNQWGVYRITGTDAEPQAAKLNVPLPDEIKPIAIVGEPWHPSDAQLRAFSIAAGKAPGPSKDAAFAFHLIARDHYPPGHQQALAGANSLFLFDILVRSKKNTIGGATYYTEKVEPGFLSGRFTAGSVTAAYGAPLVLGFGGAFSMYRLPE